MSSRPSTTPPSSRASVRNATQLPATERRATPRGFVLPPELSWGRNERPSTVPLTRTKHLPCPVSPWRENAKAQTLSDRPKLSRFGMEPLHLAAGEVYPSRSSVRTYPFCGHSTVNRIPTGPSEDLLNLFQGTAGLPSWHRLAYP
eukprot:symbB.v1.2.002260.t1/scaffold92.1/size545918/17